MMLFAPQIGQCPSCSLLIRIIFDQVCPPPLCKHMHDPELFADRQHYFEQMDFEEYAEPEEAAEEEIKVEKVDTAAPASVAVAA